MKRRFTKKIRLSEWKNLTAATSCTFGAFNEEHQLVGVVTLLTEEKEAYKHKGHIVAMYVDASNRRSGLARELIRKAIEKQENELGTIDIRCCIH